MEKILTCSFCGGEMKLFTGPKYSRTTGAFLIVLGLFFILFWIGCVLGIPLLLIGLYMIGARRSLWVCEDCNVAIERIEMPKKREKEVNEKEEPNAVA